MKKNFLTFKQVAELKAQHKKERDRRIADRIKAVLLRNNGWSNVEIAEALLLDKETISTHINEYMTSLKLKLDNGGSLGSLNAQQLKELESHSTMATKISYGWIKKGKDQPIATVASRTRINLTGAICLKDLKIITQSFDTIDTASTIEFLKKLKAAYPEAPTIHHIVDRAGYNRSHEVADFAQANNIKIHLLPPYSPNLNPIE